MHKNTRLLFFTLLVAFLILFLFWIDHGLIIAKQAAIEIAESYCVEETIHLSLVEMPHDVVAELLTCTDMTDRGFEIDCQSFGSNVKIWLVSMSGNWTLWGPLNADGSNNIAVLTRCDVALNAITGKMLERSWK